MCPFTCCLCENNDCVISLVSETTMVTLFCQILQEKEKTYFKQCFSANHNDFYIGTCRIDRQINYVNYMLIKVGKK